METTGRREIPYVKGAAQPHHRSPTRGVRPISIDHWSVMVDLAARQARYKTSRQMRNDHLFQVNRRSGCEKTNKISRVQKDEYQHCNWLPDSVPAPSWLPGSPPAGQAQWRQGSQRAMRESIFELAGKIAAKRSAATLRAMNPSSSDPVPRVVHFGQLGG